jgi:hypothetical protein
MLRIKENLDAVAACSEVEVVRGKRVVIFIGGAEAFFEDFNAKASFDARVREGVGRRFAASLQQALPDKRVYYGGRSTREAIEWGDETRTDELCADVSFYLEIHKGGGATLHEHDIRLLPKAVRANSDYNKNVLKSIKGGLWIPSKGHGSRSIFGGYRFDYTLDFRSSVKWGWFSTKGSLSFAELEAAIFKWADRRSDGVAYELAEALQMHRSAASMR